MSWPVSEGATPSTLTALVCISNCEWWMYANGSIDGYDNEKGSGFKKPLTKSDAVTFVRKLSLEARRYGMSTGLKNSAAIIRSVDNYISFVVNEECAQLQECDAYKPLRCPASGKKASQYLIVSHGAFLLPIKQRLTATQSNTSASIQKGTPK